ncbi:MAG: GerMN domain-containing protein [Chloroflexi bacterium]|nr:GerMN domain-containing protein [Chloroflexota bacterium]
MWFSIRARLRLRGLVMASVVVALSVPAGVAALSGCELRLGFRALHDRVPDVIGECLEDEWHDADNGDALQRTTGGLLLWRKADNRTAFTDGATTWINGPLGLQSRPNDQRFAWEMDGVRTIQVYFSRHPDSDADFSRVVPVDRTTTERDVARAAFQALIAGPTSPERAAGYFSEWSAMLRGPSTCGGSDFSLTVENGLATVRLCRPTTSAGIGQDARASAELEASLTQFPSIKRVRVLTTDSHCLFDMSGLDRCLAP